MRHQQWLHILLCVALAATMLSGCGRTPREGEVYSEQGELSIIPPKGWTIERQQKETQAGRHTIPIHIVIIGEPVEGDDVETVGVAVVMGLALPEGVNDKDDDPAVRGMLEALRNASAGGGITTDTVTINGAQWNRSVGDISQQGITMRTTSYLLLKNRRCYIMLCNSYPPEADDDYQATFEELVNSFRIE